MEYNKNIYVAEFIERPNRFNARVNLNGEEIVVHVPNTGRCKEILIPGCEVFLREENNPNRKTKYDLIGAYKGDKNICIDSQIPNKVVKEALENKAVDKLKKYTNILSEKTFGNSRFDFKLSSDDGEEYYLEVKGVTLEENGKCRFPDAPTERGKKHLLELIEVKKTGRGAGVLFLIQIEDVNEFSPNDDTDPEFANALRLAAKEGVDIFAYSCSVTKTGITLKKTVLIRL
ncbi:MAG: DNA/RNA nuclease SfsA [Clostridium sp.]|uniref:DNA/RNA nuclease SfsA n=1 Tax=Clostridium sp. DSM 8431 TaxID=1761781 RepID=UPI0008EFF463|nr:DNA/RNA nuclease SfsA [Clostridium sp. DSM 8431]MCR4943787.1 DNA/RNA nuclease SfsA [Clostridium sp.]SFU29111.1 sugar fermentation stimulation protein A [Clostridium sp. DSM 8431]